MLRQIMKKTDSIQLVLPGLEWEERSGPVSVKDAVKDAFRDIERIYEGRTDRPSSNPVTSAPILSAASTTTARSRYLRKKRRMA